MLTPAVFSVWPKSKPVPVPDCVIWRQVYGRWEFVKVVTAEEAEAAVRIDGCLHGLDRSHYQVLQG